MKAMASSGGKPRSSLSERQMVGLLRRLWKTQPICAKISL